MSTPEQYAETKQMVRQAMQEEGISAQTLIQLGDLAKQVLEDKSLYPQFLQAVIQSGLAEEDDMDEEIDYEIIGVMVALGEMVKQMIESGEIEA
jgi:ferritin